MEAMLLFLVTIIGFLALDVASQIWGVDSREQYQDDHTR
jgi:nitrogen fixation-related uncharacterized protein